jgi:ATP/maltotriose-dependent transcriptional regulator MalT
VLREPHERALIELRACVALVEDNLPHARELLLSSMPAIPSSLSATLLRYIFWASHEPTEIVHARDIERPQRPTLKNILTLCLHAALEFEHLRPTVAANLAAEALLLATERYGTTSSTSCLPAVLLAQIAYEQGRLAEAENLVRSRAEVIRACGVPECALRAYILLARLSMHQGRSADALDSLREAAAIGKKRKWPRLISVARAERARVSFLDAHRVFGHGTPEPANTGINGTGHGDVSPRYSLLQAALAHIASPSERIDTQDRHRILISCLRIGATRGLHRLFVDAGAPILRLIEALRDDSRLYEEHSFDLRPYVGLLLKASMPAVAPIRHTATPAHHPLSQREKAILRRIAHGMSNKRVALDLGITPETVKSHTKSIFLKLGTRTRAQAVAQAASADVAVHSPL